TAPVIDQRPVATALALPKTETVIAPPPAPPAQPEPVPSAPPVKAAVPEPASQQPAPLPPRAIHQVRPELSPNVKAMLTHEVQVQVRVTVDAAGRVTDARALPVKGTVGEYVGKAAAATARLWRFEPSRPGEIVLEFRFAPEKRKF